MNLEIQVGTYYKKRHTFTGCLISYCFFQKGLSARKDKFLGIEDVLDIWCYIPGLIFEARIFFEALYLFADFILHISGLLI